MEATAVRPYRPLFDASAAKPRISSAGIATDASKPRVDVNQGDKEGDIAPDPAAFRARLKHRAPPTSTTSATTTAYDKVLDTARRLAELELQRAQDMIYIRTLEQTRATLMRDAQSAARARADAERALVGEREARRGRGEAEAARDEAVRVAGLERGRAERAEARVRALEAKLEGVGERVRELEEVVEGERRRREEWEGGLEALASGSAA